MKLTAAVTFLFATEAAHAFIVQRPSINADANVSLNMVFGKSGSEGTGEGWYGLK